MNGTSAVPQIADHFDAPRESAEVGQEPPYFKRLFLGAGGNEETFEYRLRKGFDGDIPYVVEVAFGLDELGLTESGAVSRHIVTGANWSAAIANPFRSFGKTGEGLESTLAKVRANDREPISSAA